MKRLLYLILLLPLLLSSCVTSKRTTFLSIPDLSKPDTINIAEYEKKYPKCDGVYLNYERTIEHTGEKTGGYGYGIRTPWEFHTVKKNKYVVLNPDNQKLTTFELTTGKYCDFGNFYINVSSPDGSIKQYHKVDLTKETNSDNEITYKLIYPNIKKGSIVENGYELSYNTQNTYVPLEYDVELQFSIPCEKLSFSYAYPNWWKIKTKKISDSVEIDYKMNQDSVNNKTILHYNAENIPAFEDEPYAPYYKEVSKYLDIKITEAMMSGNSMSSYTSWEKFGSMFKDYVMNRNGFLTSRVSDVTEEITNGCRTDYEKFDKIITYIQQNIEVVHDGINRNFADILKSKKGSIYSINGLAHSMLIKAGLSAEFILIHSASEGYFDPDYISDEQFSIPAVRAIIDSKEYVVQPYEKYYPVDYIPDYIQDQNALIISNDKPAVISKIKSNSFSENCINENYDLKIDENGVIQVKEEKLTKGSFAFFIRSVLSEINEDDKDKFIKNLLTYSEGDVKINKYEILNLDSCKKPLIIKFDYEINNLVTVTPEEVIFQTGGLFSPSSLKKTKIETDKRQNPIKIYYNEVNNKNISISFPDTWKVQNELPDIDFKNSFGKVNSHYEVGNGSLKAILQQNLNKCSAPKEKIVDLIEISGSKSKLSIPTIIFKKTM